MNTVEIKAVFRNEPPAEAVLDAERRLKNLAEILVPGSQPELASGQGSFWITVGVVGSAAGGWLAIQTASWALKKYILDSRVAPMLQKTKGEDECIESKPISNSGDSGAAPLIVPEYNIQPNETNQEGLQNIIELLKFAEPIGLTRFSVKELRTNVESQTGVQGRIIHLTMTEEGKWKAEFLQVDTREDFYAS